MYILLLFIPVAFLFYLLCLSAGNGRAEEMWPFTEVAIAHRGLFDNEKIPENSLPAFEKAVEAGYGIELDVQITADGKLVVFHDESLKRMCGAEGLLTEQTFSQLQELPLLDTQEKIPLFEEALTVIGGKVPLIVEIKKEGDWKETTRKAAKMLDHYSGKFCVESFHPLVVRWFKKHRPQVLRGQLSSDFFKEDVRLNPVVKFLTTNLMLNIMTKPDFIAYCHRYRKQVSFRICKRLFPVVCAAWTIKSQEEMDAARKDFQVMIFDHFRPAVRM